MKKVGTVKVIVVFVAALLLSGCGLKIAQEDYVRGLGCAASSLGQEYLPQYKQEVYDGCEILLAALDKQGVDVKKIIKKIVDYTNDLILDKRFADQAFMLKQMLSQFEAAIIVHVDAGEWDKVITLTRAFLEGVRNCITGVDKS